MFLVGRTIYLRSRGSKQKYCDRNQQSQEDPSGPIPLKRLDCDYLVKDAKVKPLLGLTIVMNKLDQVTTQNHYTSQTIWHCHENS